MHAAVGRRSATSRFLLALVVSLAVLAGIVAGALAKAPALATVAAATPLLVAPQGDASEVRRLQPGDEVELTGGTAVGYLAVSFRGERGWVAAANLAISGRVGIPLAAAPNGAAIVAAPLPDAGVLGRVPPGGVVLLTGAHVDGFVAGSHDGVGGWIDESDLTLPMDPDGIAR